ncbi:dynamin family protein [Burkholderiaceae bacterium FT117]|uniref:dynamin family protein n=1 Tax=Zeimonas sediminis TaxID=2944268 RepID=UPI002342F083|nr:dynamin family protein [Zeimonas sediminis]MCM5571789.1 dynamin family protein [Zeimonas sediminis]
MESLERQMADFGGWRAELRGAIEVYGRRLAAARLVDADVRERLDAMLARLAAERLSVAFVAEFSRGKSELINALFFGDAGRRIVPSSAGRTTMCPTELLWDPARPPSVRLLPIETRAADTPLSALRDDASAWHEIGFDPSDPASLERAIASVSETIEMPAAQAAELGFADDEAVAAASAFRAADGRPAVGDDGARAQAAGGPQPHAGGGSREVLVEVPRWRHAIVNHPHPLLARGLVIIDTPGLNAIGAEPELTLRLIPEADAVLFLLAADAGVTRSDVEIWRRHVDGSHGRGRFAVLNKIDGLWDGLRDDVEIELEIARQVGSVSRTLDLPPERIFPVSAQKALVARLRGDAALLRRSRLPELERALGGELVGQRREIVRERLRRDFDALHRRASAALGARRRAQIEQQMELASLRGRNREAIARMAAQVQRDREDFARSLRQLQALRAVLGRHAQAVGDAIGPDVARRNLRDVRDAMRGSYLSTGLRDGMVSLVRAARADFDEAARHLAEISTLMNAMYRSFSAEHGLSLGNPARFSMRRHLAALERIEQLQRRQFGAMSLVANEKYALMRKFFESVALRTCELYERLARDFASWQRAVMAPIESQVREHQAQLRRRADSVQRVLEASDGLEARIAEVESARAAVEERIAVVEAAAREVRALLEGLGAGEALAPSP